ncbi:MAG TPA: cytidylate kinase-like family protein [Phycisphaerae bacterium]|jgi:cytidylate kinase
MTKPEVSLLAERQMRNWELARRQRVARSAPETAPQGEAFVCISRAVGSGGSRVAQLLGERLGWATFDREILQFMAGDDRLRAQLYESMDERDESWLESVVRCLLEGDFHRDDYCHRLVDTVLRLARKGPAVFLGRATDLFLPQAAGLRVRIIAPREVCLRNFAARRQLDLEEARRTIERIERERAEFIRHHFQREAEDPTRYDLIINRQRFSEAQAVELIVAGLRVRGML